MTFKYEKFSPTTQQYSNIKMINKKFRFSKHYILETCNQHLLELIFKPVLDSWKFNMLLLYTLCDDWTIFMISDSNE